MAARSSWARTATSTRPSLLRATPRPYTRFTATGASTLLVAARDLGPITQSPDGNFYGVSGSTTRRDGGHGALFAMTPNGTIVPIASLDRSAGFASKKGLYSAAGPVAVAADGTVYGTTVSGSAPWSGTVFRVPAPGLAADAEAGVHSITLRWTYVRGAKSYRGYEGTSPGGEGSAPIATLTGNETVLPDLWNGTYYFTVAAIGSQGESARSVETTGLVNTPDPFTFAPATNAARKTVITSDPVTITGLAGPAPITSTGGRYSINGGRFVTNAGTVGPGDAVRVQRVSATRASRIVTATVVVGGVAGTFSITTGS